MSIFERHGMKKNTLKIKASLSAHAAALPSPSSASTPEPLKNFPSLPDEAYVRLPVVAALFACSASTVWRQIKKGVLPAGHKHFDNVTAWNVGEIRKALRGEAWK